MYLTYEEYQVFGGTLEETAFNDIEFEAESYIDWYTFNRLWKQTEYPERLKKCVFHIIRLLERQLALMGQPVTTSGQSGDTGGSQIASMSNDGVSISYNVVNAHEALELTRREVDRTIEKQLAGVTNNLGKKLLYRGIYPDE